MCDAADDVIMQNSGGDAVPDVPAAVAGTATAAAASTVLVTENELVVSDGECS